MGRTAQRAHRALDREGRTFRSTDPNTIGAGNSLPFYEVWMNVIPRRPVMPRSILRLIVTPRKLAIGFIRSSASENSYYMEATCQIFRIVTICDHCVFSNKSVFDIRCSGAVRVPRAAKPNKLL